jgi:hypothetical protein
MLWIASNHGDKGKEEHNEDQNNFSTCVCEHLLVMFAFEYYLESQNSLSPYHLTANTFINL